MYVIYSQRASIGQWLREGGKPDYYFSPSRSVLGGLICVLRIELVNTVCIYVLSLSACTCTHLEAETETLSPPTVRRSLRPQLAGNACRGFADGGLAAGLHNTEKIIDKRSRPRKTQSELGGLVDLHTTARCGKICADGKKKFAADRDGGTPGIWADSYLLLLWLANTCLDGSSSK